MSRSTEAELNDCEEHVVQLETKLLSKDAEIERLKSELAEATAARRNNDELRQTLGERNAEIVLLRRQNDQLASLIEEQRQRLNDLCPLIQAANEWRRVWSPASTENLHRALEGIKPYDGPDHAHAIDEAWNDAYEKQRTGELVDAIWRALAPRQRDQFLRDRK